MVVHQNTRQEIIIELLDSDGNDISTSAESNITFTDISEIEFCFGNGRNTPRVYKHWFKSINNGDVYIPDSHEEGCYPIHILLTEEDTKHWTGPIPIQARIRYTSGGRDYVIPTNVGVISCPPTLSNKTLVK